METTTKTESGTAKASRVRHARNRIAGVLVGVAMLVAAPTAAFAVDPSAPSDVYTGQGATLATQMLIVAAAAVVGGLTVFGIRKGWKIFRSFF